MHHLLRMRHIDLLPFVDEPHILFSPLFLLNTARTGTASFPLVPSLRVCIELIQHARTSIHIFLAWRSPFANSSLVRG
jgi:di/tricarboxylate transporter